MIVLSNRAAQTIQPGEYVVFDTVVQQTGCDAFYQGTGPLHIRCGLYAFDFTGNVGGAAGTQPNLAITVDGSELAETTMTATTAIDTDVFNVHCATRRRNCFNGAVVAVKNTGTTPVVLQSNPALVVERRA